MPNTLIKVEELDRASDLADLMSRARALGLGATLEHPLEVLYEMDSIDEPTAQLLDRIATRGTLPTIGDLVADARCAGAVAATDRRRRGALLTLVARYLQEQADSGAAQGKAWVDERGIERWLSEPASVLDGAVGWEDRRWLYTGSRPATLGELLVGHPSAPPKVRQKLQAQAHRFLESKAAEVRQELSDEKALLDRPPPDEPLARGLYHQARAARDLIRETVAPAGRAWRARARLELTLDPLALIVIEESWPHQTRVRVPLQPEDPTSPLRPLCPCPKARCEHLVGALDLLLGMLTGGEPAGVLRSILRELAVPPWARALGELDQQLSERASGGIPDRVVWRLGWLGNQFRVTAVLQRPRKGGGFTAGARLKLHELHQGELPSPVDHEVARLLCAEERSRAGGFVARALQALVGHPHVTLDEEPYPSIAVRGGALSLGLVEREGGAFQLTPLVDGRAVAAERLVDGHDVHDSLAWILDEERRVCTVMTVAPEAMAVVALLARRGGHFPPEAVPSLLERLPRLAERVAVKLPPALCGAQVAPDPRVLLRLEADEQGALRVSAFVRPLADGPAHLPGAGPVEVVAWRKDGRVHTRRVLADEEAHVRQAVAVLPLRPEAEDRPFSWLIDQGDEPLTFVGALAQADERFVVEWLGEAVQVTRTATSADLRIRIADKRDWFGVSGELQVDGATVPLADLLAALRARRRFVQVQGGMWVRLGDELRARLQSATDHIEHGQAGQALEISPMAAPALADLLGDEGTAPRRLRQLISRMRNADARVADPAPELVGVLRDYQLTGFRWLARLQSWAFGACLADDMGVGKTLQALALLCERAKLGPALVIAPTSVNFNWVREMQRFTPSLVPVVYRETERGAALAGLGPGMVLIASYGLVARDAEELAAVSFSTLVLDEAQALKNPATQRARAVASLNAEFRLALTGTPVENRLAELWSLFRVVVPGLLGSWERFRERFATPIERDKDPERRAALSRLVRPFMLRRLKSEVARELPSRTEVREDITLSPPERALYEGMRRAILAELARPKEPKGGRASEQRRFQVLAGLLRLRQLACHPRLVDDASTVPSAKLERCLELCDELREGGHRALVFSQFTSHLAKVREALDAAGVTYLYLDGETPPRRREELVDAFQRGEAELFLISLKAGGTGLNLTAADVVIHLDPWWNPAVEDQATDRAHRIGQERPVTVYRLVSRETVEEAILELHADKRRLVAGILEGTGGGDTMTTEELLELLRA